MTQTSTSTGRLTGARPLTDRERAEVARNPHYGPDSIAPPSSPRSTDSTSTSSDQTPQPQTPQNGQ